MQVNHPLPLSEDWRGHFPILSKVLYGKYPLVYLDNAATTQKPRQVVEAMTEEYYNVNANVHRGVHFLSQQATEPARRAKLSLPAAPRRASTSWRPASVRHS